MVGLDVIGDVSGMWQEGVANVASGHHQHPGIGQGGEEQHRFGSGGGEGRSPGSQPPDVGVARRGHRGGSGDGSFRIRCHPELPAQGESGQPLRVAGHGPHSGGGNMTDLQKTIEYIFKLSNDVTASAKQASESTQEADVHVKNLEHSQESLQDTVDITTEKIRTAETQTRTSTDAMERELQDAKRQAEQLDLVAQLTTLMGIREGVSAVTGGIIGLGIVSDETAQDLQKVNAAFSVMAGAVTSIKALQAVMTTLNATEAVGTVLTALRTALSSPTGIIAVGAGLGAAAGVAGALLMTTNNNTSVTNNIRVDDTTPKQSVSEIYQVVGGGAL